MLLCPYFTPDKHVLPFDKIMELERIDDWTFRSVVKAWSPTDGQNGTYGGHVFAQAAWAAAQTIPEGYMINNITGFFILGGDPEKPFTYRVVKVRDGYNYITRSVTVSQIASHGDMFTCTCSFKREEDSSLDVQDTVALKEFYRAVLQGKENEPMQHERTPSHDSLHFREIYLPAHPEHFNPTAGLHLRKVDMSAFNKSRDAFDRRQLMFYSLRGALPLPTSPFPPPPQTSGEKMSLTREANLHACTHLYASDRNTLYIIPDHFHRSRDVTRLASLSHTVIFHVGIRDIIMPAEPRINHPNADPTLWEDGPTPICNMGDVDEKQGGDADGRRWFVQEAWAIRVAGGRALHTSRMWNYDSGVHIATTFQDGLLRFRPADKL